jgi:hypothetical protein
MAEQDATAVAITGGTINNTTIGATTATTGKFTSVTTPSVTATTTDLNLYSASTGNVIVNQSSGGAFGLTLAQDISTPTNSTRLFLQSSGGVSSIGNLGGNQVSFRTAATIGTSSGTEQARVSHTASAVNYVQVTGGTTGNAATISAQGSDANIFMQFFSKGGNGFNFYSNNGTNRQLRIDGGSNGTNFLGIAGSATGQAPILSVASQSTDTNVSMAFQPKGTGAIDLAAGSSGVNISNGGTVTAITITNSGATAYTSHPTPAITAPTTAGGVQATATSNLFYNSALATTSIVNGGTGYTVGNLLTVVGGTSTATAQFTVSAVSSGVVTAITGASGGTYSVIPTGTLSVTGGSGTGFTFTINGWAVRSLNITNAGSGYIEQPTVTFSGGGGSGAAAYAVVGNTTITRGLASVSTFHSPSGETLRLSESGGTSVASVNITNGSSSQNTVYLTAYGSATNPNLYLASKGTGNIIFATNTNNTATGTQQAQISHTASAVNYVQVTGAATGNTPAISAQGSDANINLLLNPKGTGQLNVFINNGSQFRVSNTASAVNYLEAKGNTSSNAPQFSAQGTDTNIDLALTPKGTGLVRFGTYVAGVLLATGYINIKAADGTTYKVLVST